MMEKTTEKTVPAPPDRGRIRRLPSSIAVVLVIVLLAAGFTIGVHWARRQQWSTEIRDAVYVQCLVQAARMPDPQSFCTCFTRELERVSPDPETDATVAEGRTAVGACLTPNPVGSVL